MNLNKEYDDDCRSIRSVRSNVSKGSKILTALHDNMKYRAKENAKIQESYQSKSIKRSKSLANSKIKKILQTPQLNNKSNMNKVINDDIDKIDDY